MNTETLYPIYILYLQMTKSDYDYLRRLSILDHINMDYEVHYMGEQLIPYAVASKKSIAKQFIEQRDGNPNFKIKKVMVNDAMVTTKPLYQIIEDGMIREDGNGYLLTTSEYRFFTYHASDYLIQYITEGLDRWISDHYFDQLMLTFSNSSKLFEPFLWFSISEMRESMESLFYGMDFTINNTDSKKEEKVGQLFHYLLYPTFGGKKDVYHTEKSVN